MGYGLWLTAYGFLPPRQGQLTVGDRVTVLERAIYRKTVEVVEGAEMSHVESEGLIGSGETAVFHVHAGEGDQAGDGLHRAEQQAGELGEGFGDDAAGHDRVAGEVSGEKRLVRCEAFDGGGRRLRFVEIRDLIEKEKRRSVGQSAADFVEGEVHVCGTGFQPVVRKTSDRGVGRYVAGSPQPWASR